MIEAHALSKYFKAFVAVDNVSFSIPAGQVVALLGPNGAGKTTVMRLLTGFLSPSEGNARIGGFDVVRDRLAAAAVVGYLPENGPVYPDMTPLETLRFFGRARGLDGTTLKRRLDTVIESCDIRMIVDKSIGRLSKGLRQRVGMAQALLHDPPVLILDEPTAGLDPNQIRHFRIHVQELRKTKTLLVSTHILQEVEAIAERVLLIHEGRLVFDGPVDAFGGGSSLEERFQALTRDGDGDREAATGVAKVETS